MGTEKKSLEQTMFWKGLAAVQRILMMLCSISTVILIVIGVVMRYILKMNFYGSEEIIIIAAFWLYFLGASYGSFEQSHIKADLVHVYVKNIRLRDGLTLIAQIVTTFVSIVCTKWGFDYLVWGIVKMPLTTGLKIPLVIPQSAIFTGFALMTFYHIYYLIKSAREYFGYTYGSPAAKVTGGED